MTYKCLDTNIILLDAKNILTLGSDGSTIVLPETVLDEIDSKKSGFSEVAFQAREFGRLLTKATEIGTHTINNCVITELLLNNIPIHIVALTSYPEFTDSELNIRNDRKILQVALSYPHKSLFITNDVMCRIRAISLGIEATDFKSIEHTDAEYTKYYQVSPEVFSYLHNTPILDVDPDYHLENFNYIFSDSSSGQTKLANIRNGYIDVIGKETETELRRQDAPPQNSGQLFLSRAIQNPNIDLVIVDSLAGSGKTVTALSNAVQLVKRHTLYDSITYIRASVDDVEKAEEIGFLSGNDEKIAVYLHPLHDTIEFLVRENNKDSKLKGKAYEEMINEKIEKYVSQYNITGMIGLGLRGRTFTNTVAIIDEVQNMSNSSLQKVLTRFGKNCKIILIGSNKQIDNPYITKYTNGLSTVLHAATQPTDLIRAHVVPLNKVLRSPLAEWSELVFSK